MNPGYQATQAIHAATQFLFEHQEIAQQWFERSNYLGFLSVKDEQSLLNLISKASENGIKYSVFFEPDLKYEITAVTLAPGRATKKLCSKLKLALKD